MTDFENPDFKVTPVGPMTVYSSGDEFPFVPFNENEDELGMASFNN
jgi:hypothetical protein